MPHLESKTKLIITASVNKYINPYKNRVCLYWAHPIVVNHSYSIGS